MPALGEMSLVLEKLEQLLVTNTIFVAQCALDSLTPADQIFWHAYRPATEGEVTRPTALKRPFIVVKCDDHVYNKHSVGCMTQQATLKLHINDRMRSTNFKESTQQFTNFVGQLMDEFSATNGQDDSLVIQTMTLTTAPTCVARREMNEDYQFWFCEYDLKIGAEFD